MKTKEDESSLCIIVVALENPVALPPVVSICCMLSQEAGPCQLATYTLKFPAEKPNLILAAGPTLAGGPGSLGPDCAFPSHSLRHWPQALSLISQPGFTLNYTQMMGEHIVFFCLIMKREHKGAFIIAVPLCSPLLPAQVLERWMWLESGPKAPPALSTASVSPLSPSPSPSEGFSFFLWHPFSLN